MREEEVEYLHLPAGGPLPDLVSIPSRMVVLVEQEVADDWQDKVSGWIVDSGCLYMMAWGKDCSSWDESVDWAMIRKYNFADISDDDFVMTTWHNDEPMSEAFEHCILCACHPTIELEVVRLVHIAPNDSREEILEAYALVKDEMGSEDLDADTKTGLAGWLKRKIRDQK